MVVSGEVPSVKAGRKYLIDMDGLFAYLKGDASRRSEPDGDTVLQPVPERMMRR